MLKSIQKNSGVYLKLAVKQSLGGSRSKYLLCELGLDLIILTYLNNG